MSTIDNERLVEPGEEIRFARSHRRPRRIRLAALNGYLIHLSIHSYVFTLGLVLGFYLWGQK